MFVRLLCGLAFNNAVYKSDDVLEVQDGDGLRMIEKRAAVPAIGPDECAMVTADSNAALRTGPPRGRPRKVK